MGKVQVRVEHALGRDEALRRIRRAAEELCARNAGIVRTLEWSETGARVGGDDFTGTLTVAEREVVADVELGWKLSYFPLKAQREAEAWLRALLT